MESSKTMNTRAARLFFGSRLEIVAVLAFVAVLLAAYLPTLVEMVGYWQEPQFGHCILMPFVAAWIVWERRKKLRAMRRATVPGDRWLAVGAAVAMAFLLGLLLLGEMQFARFFKTYSFVGVLGCAIAILYGARGLRALAVPLLALALMCPTPFDLNQFTVLHLKRHATVLATGLLDASGSNVTLRGNMIHIPGIDDLWIADACSGINSFVSLLSVAILGCALWKRHWGLKLVVILSCVPISIVVNASRIWLTAWLSRNIGPEAASGFWHTGEGLVLFIAAALLLFGWAFALHKLMPRAPQRRAKPRPLAPAFAALRGPGAFATRRAAYGVAMVLLLASAVSAARVRGQLDADGTSLAEMQARLNSLPLEIGEYRGKPQEMDAETIEISGADAYSSVLYEAPEGAGTFQVYLGGLVSNRRNLHTPNVCMPAQGWEVLRQDSVKLAAFGDAEGASKMRRMLLQEGNDQMVVYYWFQSGDRFAGNEWALRIMRLKDILSGSDLPPTVLVTVYVPVKGSIEATEKAAGEFLKVVGGRIRAVTAGGPHG